MPIDANILLQSQPIQLQNPLAGAGQIAQIQGAQQQNRLAQLQYDQAQRGVDQENKLNSLYQGDGVLNPDGTINRTALYTGAAQSGLGSRIPLLQKQFADADKATADVDETKAKTKKIGFESANLALTQGRDMLNTVNDAATGRQWLAAQYANPDTAAIFNKFGPLEMALQRYDQQTATPEGFAKWKQGASLTADQLVKFTTPDANTVANNETSRLNNKDTNDTSRANNKATVGATIRGQDLVEKRSQQQLEQGKLAPGYRYKADGSGNQEAIPGGPADLKNNKESAQRTQDAKDVLAIADEADKLLPSASNGYLSQGANVAAGALGVSTNAAQADAQLRVLQGALVSKMPKMSGPQSDKDVLLYQQMAGQIGDPSVPIKQRQAALQTVRKLQQKYLGQDSAPAAAPASDGWSVTEVK